MDTSSNVRVGVRVRPMLDRELTHDARPCLTHPHSNSVLIGKRRTGGTNTKMFTYDYVFGSDTAQDTVYNTSVMPLVNSSFEGYNVTILAYGQTGSGKTYTMGSQSFADDELPATHGIIPRFIRDLFNRMEAQRHQRSFVCRASLLEIYNEDIIDLLETPSSDTSRMGWSGSGAGGGSSAASASSGSKGGKSGGSSLQIREDRNGISVPGLRETEVRTLADVLHVLQVGSTHRTTASTLMNDESSRSHAVFTLTIESTPLEIEEGDDPVQESQVTGKYVSKLTFVDLAGSERLKRTQAAGARMKEGIHINVGLLALGNVINALGDEERLRRNQKAHHVPYRDSKLTRLLQEGLGGNSRTLFLACVSPADINADETLNTLRYAHRARNIRNRPTKNVDPNVEQLIMLRKQIQVLQVELARKHFAHSGLALPPDDVALLRDPGVREYLRTVMEKTASHSTLFGVSPKKVGAPGAVLPPVLPALPRSRKASAASTPDGSPVGAGAGAGASASASAGVVPPVPVDPSELLERVKALDLGDPASSSSAGIRSRASSTDVPPGMSSFSRAGASGLDVIDDVDDDDVDIDGEVEALEKELSLEQYRSEMESSQQQGEERLVEFETQINSKEKLLDSLRSNLEYYESMRVRLEELQGDMRRKEEERQLLERQIQEAEEQAAKGKMLEEVVQRDRQKLEQLQSTIKALKTKLMEQRRMVKVGESQRSRVQRLESEIQKLKEAKTKLARQQKEAAARHRHVVGIKTREVEALRKRHRGQAKEMSALQQESKRQAQLLTRRSALLDQTKRQLKGTEAQLLRLMRIQRQRDTAARAGVGSRLMEPTETSRQRRGGGPSTTPSASPKEPSRSLRHRSRSPRQKPSSKSKPSGGRHSVGSSSKKSSTGNRRSVGGRERRDRDSRDRERGGGRHSLPSGHPSSSSSSSHAVSPERLLSCVTRAKTQLDTELMARVRKVEAERTLMAQLSRRAELLRRLTSCIAERDTLVAPSSSSSSSALSSAAVESKDAEQKAGADDATDDVLGGVGALGIDRSADLDREIESLEMRVSLTDGNIEEAMAELGLDGNSQKHPALASENDGSGGGGGSGGSGGSGGAGASSSSSRDRSGSKKPVDKVGSLVRLDGLLQDLSSDEARNILRLYLLEHADLLSRESLVKASYKEAVVDAEEAKSEAQRAKHALESVSKTFAQRLSTLQHKYEAELISMLPYNAGAGDEDDDDDDDDDDDVGERHGDGHERQGADNDAGHPSRAASAPPGASGDAPVPGSTTTTAVVSTTPPPPSSTSVPISIRRSQSSYNRRTRERDRGSTDDRRLMSSALASMQQQEAELQRDVTRLQAATDEANALRCVAEAKVVQKDQELMSVRNELGLLQASARASSEDAGVEAARAMTDLWDELGIPEEQRKKQILSIENAVASQCMTVMTELMAARATMGDDVGRSTRVYRVLCNVLGEDEAKVLSAKHAGLMTQSESLKGAVAHLTEVLAARLKVHTALMERAQELVMGLAIPEEQTPPAVRNLLEVSRILTEPPPTAAAAAPGGGSGVHGDMGHTADLTSTPEPLTPFMSPQPDTGPQVFTAQSTPGSRRDFRANARARLRARTHLKVLDDPLDTSLLASPSDPNPTGTSTPSGPGSAALAAAESTSTTIMEGITVEALERLPAGAFSPDSIKSWEAGVRGLVGSKAHRRLVVTSLTDIVRVLMVEMDLNTTLLKSLPDRIDVKQAARVARDIDAFIMLMNGATQSKASPPASPTSAVGSRSESGSGSGTGEGSGGGAPLDVLGGIDRRALEEVLADVRSSASGFNGYMFGRVVNVVAETGSVLSLDSFTVWHMQILAVCLALLHRKRSLRVTRRTQLALALFHGCRRAAETFVETCSPSSAVFTVLLGRAATTDARSRAMELALELAKKIKRSEHRFRVQCAKVAALSPLRLQYCDVALKFLHGLIRRMSGSLLYRVQELWDEVVSDNNAKSYYWAELRKLSSEGAHDLVDWVSGAPDPMAGLDRRLQKIVDRMAYGKTNGSGEADAIPDAHASPRPSSDSGASTTPMRTRFPLSALGLITPDAKSVADITAPAFTPISLSSPFETPEGGGSAPPRSAPKPPQVFFSGTEHDKASAGGGGGVGSSSGSTAATAAATTTSTSGASKREPAEWRVLETALMSALEEPGLDSWRARPSSRDATSRKGKVQLEPVVPTADPAHDPGIADSDDEQELYTSIAHDTDLPHHLPADPSTGLPSSSPIDTPSTAIKLHDGTYRIGIGLAWVVCKQSVALDGIAALLVRLMQLGETRVGVVSKVHEVLSTERKLVEMMHSSDPDLLPRLNVLTSRYPELVEELRSDVRTWEADHHQDLLFRRQRLLPVLDACLEAPDFDPRRGLSAALAVDPARSKPLRRSPIQTPPPEDGGGGPSGRSSDGAGGSSSHRHSLRRPSPTTKIINGLAAPVPLSPAVPSGQGVIVATPVATAGGSSVSGGIASSVPSNMRGGGGGGGSGSGSGGGGGGGTSATPSPSRSAGRPPSGTAGHTHHPRRMGASSVARYMGGAK